MDILKINWITGYIELNVNEFFPCTQEKGKKIFPLICRWCSDETVGELKAALESKISDLKATQEMLANKIATCPAGCRQYKAEFKRHQAQIQKYERNIIMLKDNKRR